MARFCTATRLYFATSCVVAGLMGAAPAQAAQRGDFMDLGPRVAPPRGYIDFCSREPAECPPSLRMRKAASKAERLSDYWRVVFESYEPAALPRQVDGASVLERDSRGDADSEAVRASGPLSTTAALWRDLNEVNLSVNARITSAPDSFTYGRTDYWALPLENNSAGGDCEDYALEKRHALRARGYADNLLSIAMVTTRWGEKHAVLLVQTDQGEVVLDSLSQRISYWTDAPYRWDSRQSPDNSAVWVAGPSHKQMQRADRTR